jgi:hypothetical protein
MFDSDEFSHSHEIVLPPLVYDGVEGASRDALSPHVPIYLAEITEAWQQKMGEFQLTKPAFPANLEDISAHAQAIEAWLLNDPVRLTETAWQQRTGRLFTNNLHILFVNTTEGTPAYDTDLSRKYISLLESSDKQFTHACRVAAQRRTQSDREAILSGKEQEPTSEKETARVLDIWISDRYMTEVVDRLRNMGASEPDIKKLMN